ncbi:MAG: glycoside hydrolase family 30 beta sandwich domain-containing protein [Bacteroidota bacterium]|nr:glycoside hydrolase family 30 beta sandwich domain-containing protein [Bacteroidota bacterium]
MMKSVMMVQNDIIKRVAFLLLGIILLTDLNAKTIKVITTTSDKPWITQQFTDKKNAENLSEDIIVYPDSLMQKIDGFGGAFNELGWDALQVLPLEKQKEVMQSLFSPSGVNFSMGRVPVGASDYALSYYSYCDVKEDFTMHDFNISRDRYILIPYIKEALNWHPDLKIWASPWTPPAWMKINEHYTQRGGNMNSRTGGNDMEVRKNIMGNVTGFNMQVGYLKAYALYFSKYIQSYQAEGITIWALMPQNEIAWSPNWPCCTWRPEDLAYFVGNYLGPQFKADGIKTEIWLGTINYPDPDYVRTFLKNKEASAYIKGLGFQWTGSHSLPAIYKEFPGFNYMQTENMCGEGENSWKSLENSWNSMVHYFHNGARSYQYWNMVLDETGKSSWGWAQNSLIVIDRKTKEIHYTPEFYLMKHFSHFIQPGAYLIRTSITTDALAFLTADHKVVVICYNPDGSDKQLRLKINGSEVKCSLAPNSLSSIIIN